VPAAPSPWAALAATVLAAESAATLLRPRARAIEPAPVKLRAYFSEPEIEAGRAFARPQRRLALARGAVETGLMAALLTRPPRLLRTPSRHPARDGALTAAGLALGGTLATLPFAVAARRRSLDAGLATQSWGGWAGDVARSSAIGGVLAGAAGAGTLTLLARRPRTWWAIAAAGGVGFAGLASFAGPVLLEPIFNSFTPLPEGETRADVLALAQAAGVEVGEVFVVDASRRTTAGNAYVTGLGATKRVVLFDTLLNDYGRDELRLVVAHELSHVRHRDVVRGLTQLALVAPFAARAVERIGRRLVEPDPAHPADGIAPAPLALPALAFASGLVGIPIGIISARLSRALERRADTFALELTGAPEAMVDFQRRIAVQNRADLEPPRWLTALAASHPPTLERIGAAVAYEDGRRSSGRSNSGRFLIPSLVRHFE